jgi:heavy metal sensor kinase
MKGLNTVRAQFALWTAGLLLIVLAAFGAFVYLSLWQGLAAALDDSLRLSASQAIAAVNIENGQVNFNDSVLNNDSGAAALRARGVTIRVLDATGRVVQAFGTYQAALASPASVTAALRQQSTFETLSDSSAPDPARFFTAPIVENGQVVGIVQVAQGLGAVQDTLNRLLAALLIGGLLSVTVAGLGAYALAARALAPIDRITQTARRISAEDLSARLNLPATDDEVGRLAGTFDDMLARLDDSFQRERQFTADASHELRTPLAAMQAILSVVRSQRRTPEDYEQALADLSEEAERLRGLAEYLLQLARGSAAPITARETVDLSDLLQDVTDSLRPLAAEKGLSLSYAGAAGLCVSGDRDGLVRLFVNLVDNAVKYTATGKIDVATQAEGDTLRVTVGDTGSGIPAEHLPRVFNRFYRADAARTSPGTGLGLAIASEIAHMHGGSIEVSSTVGLGTTFAVRLPTLKTQMRPLENIPGGA